MRQRILTVLIAVGMVTSLLFLHENQGALSDDLFTIAPSSIDFGPQHDGTVHGEIWITSKSARVLKVVDAVTSCGCAVAEAPNELLPGQSARVRVRWDLSGRKGRQIARVLISLKSEEKESPRTQVVKLTADSIPAVDVSPREVRLRCDEDTKIPLRILSHDEEFRVTEVNSSNCAVEVKEFGNGHFLIFDSSDWHYRAGRIPVRLTLTNGLDERVLIVNVTVSE